MEILILSELLYPRGGGAELATWLFTKMLAQEDIKIHIVTTRFPSEKCCERVGRNVTIYRILSNALLGTRYNTLMNSWVLLSQLFNKLIENVDVIYIPGKLYSFIPILKYQHKKPIVTHLHDYSIVSYSSILYSYQGIRSGSELGQFIIHEKINRGGNILGAITAAFLNEILGKYINKLGALSDALICVSKKQASLLLKISPNLFSKIHVLYNPLPDIDANTKIYTHEPIVMYAGGDRYIKGFYVLLSAIKVLGERQKRDFKLVLVSKYSDRALAYINYLKKRYDLRAEIHGYVSRNEIIKMYMNSWALVFPSIWEEPLPYAVIESILFKTVPIASRVGGVPEIVEGTIAEKMLFSPCDSTALADRIERIMTMDREQLSLECEKMRETLYKRIDNIKVLKAFIKILEKSSEK